MKKFGICAVLLSMVLFVGCGDGKKETKPTPEPDKAPVETTEGATDAAPVEGEAEAAPADETAE